MSASAHLFVDDREIIECIPALTSAPEKAWHVLYSVPTDDQLFGFDANDAAIGIEYCYGPNIDADKAYARYVWLTAYACDLYRLDPAHSVVGHFFLDPTRKTDPVTGLAQSRRTYDQFLLDVVREFEDCGGDMHLIKEPDSSIEVPTVFRATVRLNLRSGQAGTRAPISRTLAVGDLVIAVQSEPNGEAVNGNKLWYADADNNFFWSGGVIRVTTPS